MAYIGLLSTYLLRGTGISQSVDCWDGRRVGVRVPVEVTLSLLQVVQTELPIQWVRGG
jgi:hypothetical protein